ncbi:MAG: GtrA family protein [uncultured bacterium]|nr:MAG: GtrA family protein [uncultured bacterium]
MLHLSREFITFLLVGILNTIVGYLFFVFFLFAGFHYTIAILFATCLGILFNFKTTGTLVFKNKNKRLLIHFIGIYILLYGWNVSLISLIHKIIPNFYIAGAMTSFFMAIISFYLNKHLVFHKSS